MKLTDRQKEIIKRKHQDRRTAQEQTKKALASIPKCSHGKIPTLCLDCRPKADIPF
jgi:hypothetical protein